MKKAISFVLAMSLALPSFANDRASTAWDFTTTAIPAFPPRVDPLGVPASLTSNAGSSPYQIFPWLDSSINSSTFDYLQGVTPLYDVTGLRGVSTGGLGRGSSWLGSAASSNASGGGFSFTPDFLSSDFLRWSPTTTGSAGSGQPGLEAAVREGVGVGVHALLRGRDSSAESAFTASMRGLLLSAQADLELQINRVYGFCDHVVEALNNPMHPPGFDPRTCPVQSSDPIQACGMERVMNQQTMAQLRGRLEQAKDEGFDDNRLKQKCLVQLEELLRDSPAPSLVPDAASAYHLAHIIHESAWDTSAFSAQRRPLLPELAHVSSDCAVSAAGVPSEIHNCSDFENTPIRDTSISALASLYVVRAPNFGNGLFDGRACDSCFENRYSFMREGSMNRRSAQEEFQRRRDEEYTRYLDLKAQERARTAFSEYAKNLDRMETLGSLLRTPRNGVRGSCQDPANFRAQFQAVSATHHCPTGEALERRLNSVHQALLGGGSSSSEIALFSGLVSKADRETSAPSVPQCNGQSVARGPFDRLRAQGLTDENINLLKAAREDASFMAALGACNPTNQNCHVDALRDYLGRRTPRVENVERVVQRDFLGNPLLRVLIQNKSGWDRVAELSVAGSPLENIRRNIPHFERLELDDMNDSCERFQDDLAKAICLTPDNAVNLLSPVHMRADLNDEIAKIERDRSLSVADKNLRILTLMGAACKAIVNNPGNVPIDSSQSLFHADVSADPENLADVVYRSTPEAQRALIRPRNATKTGDEFAAYATALCADAQEQERVRLAAGDGGASSGHGGSPSTVPAVVDALERINRGDDGNDRGSFFERVASSRRRNELETLHSVNAALVKNSGAGSGGNVAVVAQSEGALVRRPASVEETAGDDLGGMLTRGFSLTPKVPAFAPPLNPPVVAPSPVASGETSADSGASVRPPPRRAALSALEEEARRQSEGVRDLESQAASSGNALLVEQLRQMRLQLDATMAEMQALQARASARAATRGRVAGAPAVDNNLFDEPLDESEFDDEDFPAPVITGGGRLTQPRVDLGRDNVTAGLRGEGERRVGAGGSGGRAPASVAPADVAVGTDSGSSRFAGVGGVSGGAGDSGSSARLNATQFNSRVLEALVADGSQLSSISADQKILLMREFLQYVEGNPDYMNGNYLNAANDQLTIPFNGGSVQVGVRDISDPQIREQLRERLIRQRMALNLNRGSRRLPQLLAQLRSTLGGGE